MDVTSLLSMSPCPCCVSALLLAFFPVISRVRIFWMLRHWPSLFLLFVLAVCLSSHLLVLFVALTLLFSSVSHTLFSLSLSPLLLCYLCSSRSQPGPKNARCLTNCCACAFQLFSRVLFPLPLSCSILHCFSRLFSSHCLAPVQQGPIPQGV